MTESSRKFPHVQLRFVKGGTAASPSRNSRTRDPRTQANLGDRWGHGNRLKSSASSVITDWQTQLEERKKDQKPSLPEAIPLILQIDPTAFDADKLRTFGIEVISELEDGYILGASADLDLTKLQKKIEQFINSHHGGGKIPEVWEILDRISHPEYVLSPELQDQWGEIQDDTIYTVDIGISCIGEKSQLRDALKREKYQTDERYNNAVNKWIDDRDITYQVWDEIKSQREDEFTEFVNEYAGEVLDIIDGETSPYCELPDSSSCRIQISGKGLRDIVANFPYVFDVALPDEFQYDSSPESQAQDFEISFSLEPPDKNAPKVCVIDSGIQEQHPLLRAAIAHNDSRSWVPNELNLTADLVPSGGHGTRVAGAVLYPRVIPTNGREQAICWLQNARVLDRNCYLPQALFPPSLIARIVNHYQTRTKTRIFNHSIAGITPCRTQYMSAWAAEIDNLSWENDILVIVAAGNLPQNGRIGNSRLSVREHLQNGTPYPDYLLTDSCRVPNPAQSFQALTVGSISLTTFQDRARKSIAPKDYPSSFSCTGLGIWDSIKPEVVEYGGDLITDGGTPPAIAPFSEVCLELVSSTLNSHPPISRDGFGTSFAAPKVTHIAACLAAELPNESCLLYRALIVQSARWTDWVGKNKFDLDNAVRLLGYGIPNLDRALSGSDRRITLITRGERRIRARQAHVYQV
jgi:hypothetical protein